MYTPLNGDRGTVVGDSGYSPSVHARHPPNYYRNPQPEEHSAMFTNEDPSTTDFSINSATVFKTPNLPGASQNRRRRRRRQRFPNVPWPLAVFLSILLTPVAGFILFFIGARERFETYKKNKATSAALSGDNYRRFPQKKAALAYRHIFENAGDWLVVVCVGILYQAAVVVPIYVASNSAAHREIVDELHATGDYYGAFALTPALGLYLNMTVYLFVFLESRYEGIEEDSLYTSNDEDGLEGGSFADVTPSGVRFGVGGAAAGSPTLADPSNAHLAPSDRAGRGGRQPGGGGGRSTIANTVVVQQGITLSAKSLRTAVQIRRTIREASLVHTEFTVLIAFVIGVIEMLITRLCALSSTPCKTVFTFTDERFRQRHYYAMTSIFWVCLFTVFNVCVIYAVTVYYQQLLQLRKFRYANGGRPSSSASQQAGHHEEAHHRSNGNGQQSPTTAQVAVGGFAANSRPSLQMRLDQALKPLEDLSSPESISIWTFTWQQFILDIKRKPLTVATTTSTFLALAVTILGCTCYIAILNLNAKGSAVAEFTTPLAAVMAFAGFCMGVFVYVTVQVSNAVELHTKTIAQLQNDTQVRVNDEGEAYAGRQRQLLLAKVRVLQSLDVYLRHSDSRPKLVGMSVESLRWTVIVIGLIVLNACFFGLYYSWCYKP